MPGKMTNVSRALLAFIHVIAWCAVILFPMFSSPGREHAFPDYSFVINHLFFVIVLAAFFYLNYFLFIPGYFVKKKFMEYTAFAVASFTIVIVITSLGTPWLGHFFASGPPEIPDHDFRPGGNRGGPGWFNPIAIPAAIIIWILSTGIKMTGEWYKSGRQKEAMEKEKLSAELAYLKAQINPHFIFNVLNNICSLARKKSDETEDAIIRLSQLLRYNLYDSVENKVSLQREIQYLHDYIDIQKMRLGTNVKIVYSESGDTGPIQIEPLLFLPFIENAFKFGVSTVEDCTIAISLKAEGHCVHFRISNQVMTLPKDNTRQGIGLKNVRRRLSLLYPGRHKLLITLTDKEYIADLTIECHD